MATTTATTTTTTTTAQAAASAGISVEEQRAKDEALVNKANAIRATWKTLVLGFMPPSEAPPRNKCHWDFVQQEAAWLAHDFMQERLWRRAAAYQFAHAAASFDRKQLRHVKPPAPPPLPAPEPAAPHSSSAKGSKGSKATPAKAAAAAVVAAAAAEKAGHSNGPGPPWEMDMPVVLAPLLELAPPCVAVSAELLALVQQQLEDEDVARLSRHAEAQARYQVVYDEARKAHAKVLLEEELRRQARAKLPKGELGLGSGDVSDLAALHLPPSVRMRGGPGSGGTGRGLLADGDGADPRDKRKRKNRDYDEDYEPNKSLARDRMGMRGGPGAAAGMPPMRPDLMPGMPGMPQPGMSLEQRKASMVRGGSLKPGQLQPGKGGLPGGPLGPGGMQPAGMGPPQALGLGPDGMTRMDSMGRVRSRLWSSHDDQILTAIVSEFGQNWYLVADVLRTVSALSGVSRRHDTCKLRYIQLIREWHRVPEGQELRQEVLNSPLMAKPHAKEVLLAALPVTDATLLQHRRMLADVVARQHARVQTEHMSSREMHKFRQPEHLSHQAIQQKMLAMTGGRILTPVEFGIVSDPAAPPGAPSSQLPGSDGPQGPGQQQQLPPPGSMPPGNGMGRAGSASLGSLPPPAPANGLPLGPAGMGANPIGQPPAGMSAVDAAVAAASAAVAAMQQQQQQQMGGALPLVPGASALPPGLTREKLVQLAQGAPVVALQQQASQAQAAAQANPTRDAQLTAQSAAAVLAAAQSLQSSRQQQQQQQAMQQQQQQRGMQPGPGMPSPNGGGLPPLPPPQQPPLPPPPQQPQQGGRSNATLVSPHQIQQLMQSGRLPAGLGNTLLDMAQKGVLTTGQAQAMIRQAQAQQASLRAAQAAAAAAGMPSPNPQLGLGGGGGMGMAAPPGGVGMAPQQQWGHTAHAAAAAAAAAAANQAASQAAAAALAAGSMGAYALPPAPPPLGR